MNAEDLRAFRPCTHFRYHYTLAGMRAGTCDLAGDKDGPDATIFFEPCACLECPWRNREAERKAADNKARAAKRQRRPNGALAGLTPSERVALWRTENREKYNAYQRALQKNYRGLTSA